MEEQLLNIRLEYIRTISRASNEKDKQEARETYEEQIELLTDPNHYYE